MGAASRRKLGVVSGVVFIVALAASLVLLLAEGGLDQGDKIASIASMVIAGVSLPITLYTAYVSVRHERQATAGSGDRLDAVTNALADAVRTQWEAEEQIRHVHDPFPLPFRWRDAEDDLADHWQNIRRTPHDGAALELDGEGDHIVDTFRRIPSGRLVVLGEAGAGKTILTSRFALTLLAQRRHDPELPVPVIFSLGSFDPTRSSLRDWLTEQLVANYPVLAQLDESGEPFAVRLQAAGRILPVLDGLDEVTEGLRGKVITRVNAGLRPSDGFLLTSRPREFRDAVESTDVLTAAAVVRLDKLTVDDLNRYLPLTTRKGRGAKTKWHPVLARVGARGALFDVLSTPLMVAMARTMFSDTDADPAELLRGPDSWAAIEHRLLSGFVRAAYADHTDGVDRTEERLRFLARHLRSLGTQDIAWWRLIQAVPKAVVGVTAGLVLTTAVLLVGGFIGWVGQWPDGGAERAWMISMLVAGVICGCVGGAVIGQGRGILPAPARMRLRVRGRLAVIAEELAHGMRSWRTMAWFGVWTASGVGVSAFAFLFGRDADVLLVGLVAGLFTGVGMWFVITVIRVLGVPIDPTEITSPVEVLRTDRHTASRQGLFVGVGGTVVFWVMMRFAFEPAFGVPFQVVFGGGRWVLGFLTMAALGAVLWMVFVSAWGPWLIARLWLSLTGRLPWSMMAFLADAHQHGVLRQTGGVYQFRHARLRDYFTS